jgi:UDP-2,3-diacylglucosamine hydrolase
VSGTGSLVFVGDVHLDQGDPAVEAFVSFLDRISTRCSRLVLLGDLFNVWIGRPELEQPHQTAVLTQLARLRRRGTVVRYVEGNRDYRIHQGYAGTAIDEASDEPIVERFGGLTITVCHGDLVNPADRQYRRWRRLSRSRPFWILFRLLPRALQLRVARSAEARMRSTNLAFKQEFPEGAVMRYAEPILAGGHDAVVLGHFHVEKDLQCKMGGRKGRILVLPEWKGSRRHLEVEPDGLMRFVDSGLG